MSKDINVSGSVKLVQIYENNKNGVNYFVKLRFGLEGYGSREIEVNVSISEETYNQLKQESESSKAQETIIRVSRKLELKVDSVCIN